MTTNSTSPQNNSDPFGSLDSETKQRFAEMRAHLGSTGEEDTAVFTEEVKEETVREEPVGAAPQGQEQAAFSGANQTGPKTREEPRVFTEQGPGAPAGFPGANREAGDPPMRVGLLVWGVILMLVGLLLVALSVSVVGSFQMILVGAFAIAGIAFLILAATTRRSSS